VAPALVTLASIPREVDGAGWSRFAHLVQDLDEFGNLHFQPGTALHAREPGAAPFGLEEANVANLGDLTPHVERLRNVPHGLRACNRLDPHVDIAGPAGTSKAALAQMVAAAAGRPLVLQAARRCADWATSMCLLAGLAEGSVLFLDNSQPLSAPLLATLLEALAHGTLSRTLCDGATQRRVTLRLPSFAIVVVSAEEADDRGPREHRDPDAPRPGPTPTPLAPWAGELGSTARMLGEHASPLPFARGTVRRTAPRPRRHRASSAPRPRAARRTCGATSGARSGRPDASDAAEKACFRAGRGRGLPWEPRVR
jgi:hypothetical protein